MGQSVRAGLRGATSLPPSGPWRGSLQKHAKRAASAGIEPEGQARSRDRATVRESTIRSRGGTAGLDSSHVNSARRRLLQGGIAAVLGTLAGCDDGGDASSPIGMAPPEPPAPAPAPPSPSPTPPPATPAAWNPAVPPLLVGTNSTFDLSSTLPNGIARGGKFGIDSAGAGLPAGMTFSAAGLLAVGSAAIGTVNGVIFTYETL